MINVRKELRPEVDFTIHFFGEDGTKTGMDIDLDETLVTQIEAIRRLIKRPHFLESGSPVKSFQIIRTITERSESLTSWDDVARMAFSGSEWRFSR
jgi:hypothetical protein